MLLRCCCRQCDAGCCSDRTLSKGFFGRYEYAFVPAAAGLTLAFTGPGSLSIDALVGLPRGGTVRGIGTLLAGLVGGGTALLES
jgi:hypothetical protein